jgi:hypothetical protein
MRVFISTRGCRGCGRVGEGLGEGLGELSRTAVQRYEKSVSDEPGMSGSRSVSVSSPIPPIPPIPPLIALVDKGEGEHRRIYAHAVRVRDVDLVIERYREPIIDAAGTDRTAASDTVA